jgi:plasmid maintenance system antidote protein VapI
MYLNQGEIMQTTIHTPPANALFDHLLDKHGVLNDAALSRALEVAPPVISKHRHGRIPVGPTMILKVYDKFDISIEDIRKLLAA